MKRRFKPGDKAIVDLRLPLKNLDYRCRKCNFMYKRSDRTDLHCKIVQIIRNTSNERYEDYVISKINSDKKVAVCTHVLKPLLNNYKE